MKEILFYGFVGDFFVERFINQLNEAKSLGEGAFVKINSSGGDVFAGWGMISEFRMYTDKKKVLAHGNASSMAAVFLLFAEDVEALEQTKFVLQEYINLHL